MNLLAAKRKVRDIKLSSMIHCHRDFIPSDETLVATSALSSVMASVFVDYLRTQSSLATISMLMLMLMLVRHATPIFN